MAIFLVLQSNYHTYHVGLFSDTTLLCDINDDKKNSSRNLIPSIQSLLAARNYTLQDITALGVNQGPGPFTSLRVILTTANGLAFASGLPLIGINSLHALLLEYHDSAWAITVALLNAYNNDLYFALQTPTSIEIGCKKSSVLFEQLKLLNQPLRFIGEGSLLYQSVLMDIFGTNAYFPQPFPDHCSLEQLGLMTYEQYKSNSGLEHHLLPIYLKDLSYKPQI